MNFQKLLDKWNIKVDSNTLLSMWNESHRSYHDLSHLSDLLEMINKDKSKYSDSEYDKLVLTAIFHDCIYEPTRNDNEERSAEFLLNSTKKTPDILEVSKMILDTKTHEPSTKLSEIFIDYDMDIVNRNFDELLEWEKGIYQEYKSFGKDYKKGRINFLKSLLDKYVNNTDNILKLIDWVSENYDDNIEYGVLYGKPLFKKDSKYVWLNYSFGQLPYDLSDRIKSLIKEINTKYSEEIIIPLDYNTKPGIVCKSEVIEEIANLVYNGFNEIFNDLINEEDCYLVVWSIGELDTKEELIRQGTRIKKIPTLHNLNTYDVIVNVGRTLDSTKNPGVYKV